MTGPEQMGSARVWHRRLSFVDLSAAGHQPMVSHDRRHNRQRLLWDILMIEAWQALRHRLSA
jgi:hypothetical protein